MKTRIWETLERDPIFAHHKCSLSLEENRALTFRRAKRLIELDLVSFEDSVSDPTKPMAWVGAVGTYYVRIAT
ncbi:MAG TPA: hypothetical protein EYQ00_15915 [Dehalococcoidia bacterium]|nr:hypothetical protein [Dehalococcoidia bacterium]